MEEVPIEDITKKPLETEEVIMFELRSLPEQIRAIEKRLVAHTLKKSWIEDVMDRWNNNEMVKINSELNADGKPKFTNEIGRKAALSQKQSESKDYLELKDQLTVKIQDENNDKIDFNYLDRKFKALRVIAELIAYKRRE